MAVPARIPRFNVADDPWIDITDASGRAATVSLRDALTRAGTILTLAGPPPVTVTTLRLLVGVLRDAIGPDEITDRQRDAWLSEGLPPDAVDAYLERHNSGFELFGVHPFMQDPSLRGDRTTLKSVAELVPHAPTGASAMLYDKANKHTDLSGANPLTLTAAQAAAWLVSAHQYGRTGIYGSKDAAPPGRASGRSGLLVDRLLAVPTGSSLAQTLLLNLPCGARQADDAPPWRRAAPVIPGPPSGAVQHLTWQIRHILLEPNPDGTVDACKIAVDPAIDPAVARRDQAVLDPHMLFTVAPQHDEGWLITPYLPDRAVWRDAPALAAASARTSSALHAARRSTGAISSVEVFGLAVESTAKYVDQIRVSLAPSVTRLDPSVVQSIAEITEATRGALAKAVVSFAVALGTLSQRSDTKLRTAVSAGAQRVYFAHLADHWSGLLDNLASASPAGPLLDGWSQRCREAAQAALQEFTAGRAPSARSESARHRARAYLVRELATA